MSGSPFVAPQKKTALELNAIFENATVGILFTRNRRLVQANRLCAEMFGYALDEFIDQPALILYSDQEAYSALGREAGPVLAAGQSFRAETRLKHKDGSLFWCRVSAKAVDPDQPRTGTLWIIEDITGDRSMLEALARSTSELSAIFNSASLGIAVVREYAFARCNRRLEEILDLPAGSLVGRPIREVFGSDEEFQRIDAMVRVEFSAGERHRHEQMYLRADGKPVWLRVSGSALDRANLRAGSVWLVEDITAKELLEHEVDR